MAEPIVANVVVSMPSQLFTLARSLKAAANGKIYIGKTDTDPSIPENQIQVYIQNEDGSLVPIAQPININTGGYPVYNGQITKFVTVENHSMAVYDAINVQQFYFPDILKYEPDQLRPLFDSFYNSVTGLAGLSEIGYINGVWRLASINIASGKRVQLYDVIGTTAPRLSPVGGGVLRYDTSIAKSAHNGFSVYSPSVPFNNLLDYVNGVGETDPSGYGVYVREIQGNEIRLSYCGIYEEYVTSASTSAAASRICEKLLSLCANGMQVIFDVALKVSDIALSNFTYTVRGAFEKKLVLYKSGRIFRFNNTTAGGDVFLENMELDGNGQMSVEDGGLFQSNYVKNLTLVNPKVYGFVRNTFQANGIATTGESCRTNIMGGDLSACGSQLLYTQTSSVTIFNCFMHDSTSHGVAIVNCDDLYWLGGQVTGCDYGILCYSTTTYRSKLRRLHIQGVSLRRNNKAFEIARRYEDSSASQGNADVVLSDIDATGCTIASTIGNLATDNVDGYSIREVFLNNVFADNYLDCNSVFGVHFNGGRFTSIRLAGKIENVEVKPGKILGNSTTANTNTAIYIRSGSVVKNVKLDAFSYYGLNSYIYAEAGVVVNGMISVNNDVVDPSGMTYKINSELYGFVAFNSGNRTRDLSKQPWGVGIRPFYDTTIGKFVTWNGVNVTDMVGTVVP
ncbi:phage head-binding domain-containing protein [Serratia fonticola]|uniref:phage head-binding domain-containing protein n=1 Tax=Serratia fonticola TaxID=47917 RepID=UPI0021BDBBA0|nr:phage head-binding domain-containing protein [Serratia fonticola]